MTRNSIAEAYATRLTQAGQGDRRRAFWAGLLGLLVYVVCVCVPYHFQGYATMPITYEAAHDPSGLPSFLPIGILSYLLSAPLFGIPFLVLSAILILPGKLSAKKKLNTAIRAVLIATYVFLLLHIFDYDRVGYILDT